MSRNLYTLALLAGLSLALVACEKPVTPADRARTLAQANQLDEALAVLEAEKDAGRLTAELGLLIGGVYEARGEPSRAVSEYRKTAEQFPGSGRVELRLGEIFLQLQQYKASLDRLEKARAAGISSGDLALSLAVVHGHLGQFEEAGQELDLAQKAGVTPSIVSYNRALLFTQSGDNKAALEALLAAHEGDPENASILRQLAVTELALIEGADLAAVARAEDYVNRSLSIGEAIGSEDWRAYEVLGDCFVLRQDYEAASEMYLKAKEIGQEPAERLNDKYYDAQVILRGLDKSPNDG